MIDSAVHLLAIDGYSGASFSAVLGDSGAPRGSIYYHFPGGKDELVAAAVETARQRWIDTLDVVRGKSLTTVLRAFSDEWRAILENSNCRAGCTIISASVGATDADLRACVASAINDVRDRLRDVCVDSGVPKRQAASIAALVYSGLEGAVQFARAERSLEVFDNASKAVRRSAIQLAGV
jgi:TetR/AcrR family transcriptional regulator, lmrAB and yxaGH operons repressor